jgi:hypothetical protein
VPLRKRDPAGMSERGGSEGAERGVVSAGAAVVVMDPEDEALLNHYFDINRAIRVEL